MCSIRTCPYYVCHFSCQKLGLDSALADGLISIQSDYALHGTAEVLNKNGNFCTCSLHNCSCLIGRVFILLKVIDKPLFDESEKIEEFFKWARKKKTLTQMRRLKTPMERRSLNSLESLISLNLIKFSC